MQGTPGRLSLVLAFIAAGTACVSAFAAAYGTYLLSRSSDAALEANLHLQRIDACADAIAFVSNAIDTQRLVLWTITDNREYEVEFVDASQDTPTRDAVRGIVASQISKEFGVGSSHRKELRSHFLRLRMLFPENEELKRLMEDIGVFEFSFSHYFFTLDLAFNEEGASFGREFYDAMTQEGVESGDILSPEELQLRLDSVGTQLNEFYALCSESATIGG